MYLIQWTVFPLRLPPPTVQEGNDLCQQDESGKHSEEATARQRKQREEIQIRSFRENNSVVWSSRGTQLTLNRL